VLAAVEESSNAELRDGGFERAARQRTVAACEAAGPSAGPRGHPCEPAPLAVRVGLLTVRCQQPPVMLYL
jgi:hypothetical protein